MRISDGKTAKSSGRLICMATSRISSEQVMFSAEQQVEDAPPAAAPPASGRSRRPRWGRRACPCPSRVHPAGAVDGRLAHAPPHRQVRRHRAVVPAIRRATRRRRRRPGLRQALGRRRLEAGPVEPALTPRAPRCMTKASTRATAVNSWAGTSWPDLARGVQRAGQRDVLHHRHPVSAARSRSLAATSPAPLATTRGAPLRRVVLQRDGDVRGVDQQDVGLGDLAHHPVARHRHLHRRGGAPSRAGRPRSSCSPA